MFRLARDKSLDEGEDLRVAELARRLRGGVTATVTGSAGAGKTTALLELAAHLLTERNEVIPVFIPLADWAAVSGDFVEFAGRELEASREELVALAGKGRLVWLFDGWNEIPPDQIREAEGHLRNLVRRHASAGVVVTNRGREGAPTLLGTLNLTPLPLSRRQRRRVVERARLEDPLAILDVIESSPELDEMTTNPLFLTTALELVRDGRPIPSTPYNLLSAFVERSEREPHATPLAAARGQHRQYLQALAAALIRRGTTRLGWDEALNVVADRSRELVAAGFVGTAPDASAVLGTLVNHHLLVGPLGAGRTVGFLHHRFQEWFGAEHLARVLGDVSQGQAETAVGSFQAEVIDHPAWEDSLRFLVERLTAEHRDDSAAEVIRWTLPVDVALAASLSALVSEQAWRAVRGQVAPLLRSLNEETHEDVRGYGLIAMALTQRPDFADIMWSVLDSSDQQTRARAYDVLGAFGAESLGADSARAVRALDDARRAEFVRWVAMRGARHVGRVVVRAVEGDSSPSVRAAAIEALIWHGYYDEAAKWIRASDPTLANVEDVARDVEWLPRLLVEDLTPWLREAVSAIPTGQNRRALLGALARLGDAEALDALKEDVSGAVSTQDAEPPLPLLSSIDPRWVSDWVLERMRAGQPWSVRWLQHVRSPSRAQVEAVLDAALATEADGYRARQLISAVAGIDLKTTVSRLARELARDVLRQPREAEAHEQARRSRRDRLQDALRELDVSARTTVILSVRVEPATSGDLFFLLHCLVPWGDEGMVQARTLPTEQREALRVAALRWAELVPRWPEQAAGLRAELALLLGAVGRPEDAAMVMNWIDRDREDAERMVAATGRRGFVSYRHQYVDALVRIGSDGSEEPLLRLLHDPEYVGEASRGLAALASGPAQVGVWPARAWEAAAEARRTRAQAPDVRSHRYGREIAATIHRHLDRRGDSPGARPFAHDLATALRALARLDSGETFRLIPRLLVIEGTEWGILDAVESLAQTGIVVPVEQAGPVADRIIELFHQGRLSGSDQGLHTVLRALSVLLFSSDPAQGLAQCRRLGPRLRHSYVMRDLLQCLGLCEATAALAYLEELLDDPEVGTRWRAEILSAIARHPGSGASSRLLRELDLLRHTGGRNSTEGLVDALRSRAERDLQFKRSLLQRVPEAQGEQERAILAAVVGRLDGEEVALAACLLLDDEQPEISYGVRSCIQNACTAQEEVGSGGAYRLLPRSCASVRRLLFGFLVSEPRRRDTARRILLSIEKGRLEIGRPVDEPRHPDWRAARDRSTPWPVWRSGSAT